MTDTDMETFWTVLEHGTLTAAAEALYITQPTLSGRIQTLENEVGTQLFRRGRGQRRIELTEAGRRFVPLAQRWQTLLAETQGLRDAEAREYLRLGAVFSTNQYILPAVYRRFLTRKLPVSLWVHTLQSYGRDGIESVARREMDMAMVDSNAFYRPELTVEPLFRESFLLVCAPGSTLGDTVVPDQLDTSKEIMVSWREEVRQWHDDWFGASARPLLHSDTMQAADVLLSDEGLWALAPAAAARTMAHRGQVKVCRLSAPPPDRLSFLVTCKGEPLSPAAECFLQDMRTELSAMEDVHLLQGL